MTTDTVHGRPSSTPSPVPNQGRWRVDLAELLQARSWEDSGDVRRSRYDRARDWQATLVDHGVAAPAWPRDAGGMELELADLLDYHRMLAEAGAPPHPCPLSFIVAPTIIAHGSSEQRLRFLPPLLRADELWCQGFSEPGAGSDLASLTTRAVRDNDAYIVNGQKIWTSQADRADWIFVLARTSPMPTGTRRSTEGISYLLIPMDSPGITVRRLRDISGADHFAEIFFDDVRVPVVNRVGEEGQGWSIMRTSLGHERATAFLADEFKYRSTVDRVIGVLRKQGLTSDPVIGDKIARIEAAVSSVASNSARALQAVLRGEDPGAVASVNRLVKSEFEQQLHELAFEAMGEQAVLDSRADAAFDSGRWTYGYLMSRATTIGAGTAEIQRNTIAENVLGLPSSRGEQTRPPTVQAGDSLADTVPDERALRSAVRTIVGEAGTGTADLEIGAIKSRWSALVGFGLPGLHVAGTLGGADADLPTLFIAVEEAARGLAPVPLPQIITALELARAVGAEELVAEICAGALIVAPVTEPASTAGRRRPTWDGRRLDGDLPRVIGAPVADAFVVVADGPDGPVLLRVSAEDTTTVGQTPFDRTSTIADVRFAGVQATDIGRADTVVAAVERAEHIGLLTLGADSVGVAAAALSTAVHWARTRVQFDTHIGAFQAVSHRIVDMFVALEGARGQIQAAAARIEQADTDAAALATELAVASALDAAILCAQGCIQVLGGIGFTWEHHAHLLLRRARTNDAQAGGARALRARAAERIFAQAATP